MQEDNVLKMFFNSLGHWGGVQLIIIFVVTFWLLWVILNRGADLSRYLMLRDTPLALVANSVVVFAMLFLDDEIFVYLMVGVGISLCSYLCYESTTKTQAFNIWCSGIGPTVIDNLQKALIGLSMLVAFLVIGFTEVSHIGKILHFEGDFWNFFSTCVYAGAGYLLLASTLGFFQKFRARRLNKSYLSGEFVIERDATH